MILRLALLVLLVVAPAAAQQWSIIGQLSLARQGMVGVHLGDGVILVMGGSVGLPVPADPQAIPVATCELVDVWRRRIVPTASMLEPRSEFAAVRLPNGNVVVLGGVIGRDRNGAVTGGVELFDRSTLTWRRVGTLNTPRRQHVAGLLDSNRILVVGGRLKDYTTLTDAEIFDLRTGTSTSAASFPYPINNSTLVTSHSGDHVVVGGRTGGTNSERRNEVYAYDARANQWVLNSVLAQSVSLVSGLRLWDGRAIVAGGLHADAPGRSATEMQLENLGKWRLVSPLSSGRTGAAIAQWTESRLLVIGGFHDEPNPVVTTEWIDMIQHTSTPGPRLAIARNRFTALSIPSGPDAPAHHHTIVVIGGLEAQGSLTGAVEILEPGPQLTAPIQHEGDERSLVVDGARSARIGFAVAAPAEAAFTITDGAGRVVRTFGEMVEAGWHDRPLELDGLAAGRYGVSLTIAGERRTWELDLP